MAKIKPHIDRFGFEIEGEFSQNLKDALINGEFGTFTGDGSIHNCDLFRSGYYKNHSELHHVSAMEFRTAPIPYDRAGKIKMGKIFKLMNEYYKKKEFHYNSSMGFHIHLSFKPIHPTDIWSLEFATEFANKMKEKFKMAYRLRSNCRFCKVILDEKDIANRNCERYRFINFASAFRKHKTIEFRIFPSEKPLAMKNYVKFTLDTAHKFLNTTKLKRTFTLDIDLDRMRENILEDTITSVVWKRNESFNSTSIETVNAKKSVVIIDGAKLPRVNHTDVFAELNADVEAYLESRRNNLIRDIDRI